MAGLVKRDHGLITIADPGADRPLAELATLQCVHCGGHWVPRPGSGITRGFCTRCRGPVCGAACAACVPFLQMLDNIEAGRPMDFVPVMVFVGDEPPK